MSKPLAVFDIDGTLFRSGLYREVVYELIRMGALPEEVTEAWRDKEQAWRKRSHGSAFEEFDQAMVDALHRDLDKLKVDDFDQAAQTVIKNQKDNVYVHTRELARELKDSEHFMVAISGSQTELVAPFARYYGFDHWIGQDYKRGKKYFKGIARKTHRQKDKFIEQILEEFDVTLENSIGVGDSAGDIEMLHAVQRPTAFNPEKELAEHAQKQKWPIVIERKNMIYHLTPDEAGEYKLSETNAHPEIAS